MSPLRKQTISSFPAPRSIIIQHRLVKKEYFTLRTFSASPNYGISRYLQMKARSAI